MDVIRLQRPGQEDSASSDPTVSDSTGPATIAGLDFVRALAAIGVVLLHSGVPYLRHPMPGLVWPVKDTGSVMVDAVFWSIEVFIMPLFLVMAGFLLLRSARRRSPSQLVVSRAKRLLIPLALATVIVLPFDLYIWTLGLVTEGVVPPVKLKSFKFSPPVSDEIWGLSHLWFLLYLFTYVAATACCIGLVGTKVFQRVRRWRLHPGLALSVIATLAVATLVVAPEVVWGFQHGFLPVSSKWIYSGLFFVAGCLLCLWDRELTWLRGAAPRMLAIGMVLLAFSVTLGIWSLDQDQAQRERDLGSSVLLALLTVAAASTVTLGLIGMGVRRVRRVPAFVGYLAAASFWLYIVHQPLMGLIHLDLKLLWPAGSPVVKLGVSLCLSTGTSLLLYETVCRRLPGVSGWLGFKHLSRQESLATGNANSHLATDDSVTRRAA